MKRHIVKWIVGTLFLTVFSVFALVLYLSFKDYSEYFRSQRGGLEEVIERRDSVPGKYWITLHSSNGFKVECGMLTPRDTGKRYPAIILLGGKATGKYAIDYALDIGNVILLALDYTYEPRESYTFWTVVWDLPALRQALFDMVPSAMLATDYLFRRNDVDTTKLVILGYSFGAPFVPVIVAHDRRAAAAAMVYGGGELLSMIRHNVARYRGPLMSEFVGSLGGLLLRPMEPMRYADRISPIPLVMINGENDEQIPRYNTELFFNAAREPKKIVWLKSMHVRPNNVELTRHIIATLKEELKRLRIL